MMCGMAAQAREYLLGGPPLPLVFTGEWQFLCPQKSRREGTFSLESHLANPISHSLEPQLDRAVPVLWSYFHNVVCKSVQHTGNGEVGIKIMPAMHVHFAHRYSLASENKSQQGLRQEHPHIDDTPNHTAQFRSIC